MRGIHNTFCNHDFLDEIIQKRKKEPSLAIAYTLLDKQSNIIVDMPAEDFKKQVATNEAYKRFFKRENKSFKPKEWIKSFSPENISDDVFLINEGDIEDHKKLRQDYGCLIIANEQNDLRYLERLIKGHRFNLVPKWERVDDPTIVYQDNWAQFFGKFKMSPLNAVVITDNFMFGDKFEERKNDSLFAILKAIVPKDLKQDFHITIFFNNDPSKRTGVVPLKKEKAIELINEIKALDLCDSIKVNIVAHTIKSTTHDRELITNYHYMYSGAGFSIIDANGVKEVAKGKVLHIFCDMDSEVTVKQMQAQLSLWLKQIFDGEKGRDAQYTYIVGDDVKNRLLL